jgi:hypothetical protein
MVRNMLNGSIRLTDLSADPGEHRDVSALHPVEAARIRALLEAWRSAQLDYYQSVVAPTVSFPPRVGPPMR